ncbi:MAG TPA: hypothetical protein VJN63_09800, partial [Thermoplasmata archaeon]|nr:hypothetical protein [Thermoplasmata archaeon]
MTVPTATNRNDYVGNGAANEYSYTFRILSQTDLRVIVRNTSGVETVLTITTDYTVAGVGDLAGGTVTLVDDSQAWLTGGFLTTDYVLAIRRLRTLTQDTEISNQGPFYPKAHENVFDHLLMVSQQQQDEVDRSVKLPETIDPSTFDMSLPTDIEDSPGSMILVNETGNGLVMGPDAGDIAAAQANAAAAAASAVEAQTAETNAELAETNAELAETNAEL